MILYHGSNVAIEKIELGKSKPNKDFRKGFYLSENEEQAMEMARFKSLIFGGEPTISKFDFDPTAMHSANLRVKIFEGYSEEWADFVFANRDRADVEKYDIVYGPIADDGVTFQLRRFQAGAISIEELVKELQYAKGITFQYFFGTSLALSKLIKL
mgnify:CR=1 FL=1